MEGIEEEKEGQEKQGYDPLKWLAREDEESKPNKPRKTRLVVCLYLWLDHTHHSGKDDCTVFVSNLTFNTTEQQLRDIFEKVRDQSTLSSV